MSVKENLIAARSLIDTPEKWLQGNLGRGGCWCAVGAIGQARGWDANAFDTIEYAALDAALPPCLVPDGETRVSEYNDHHDTTHPDIMALFDRAIAACDEQVAA